jgi:hypothetical protein
VGWAASDFVYKADFRGKRDRQKLAQKLAVWPRLQLLAARIGPESQPKGASPLVSAARRAGLERARGPGVPGGEARVAASAKRTRPARDGSGGVPARARVRVLPAVPNRPAQQTVGGCVTSPNRIACRRAAECSPSSSLLVCGPPVCLLVVTANNDGVYTCQ